MNAGRSNGLRVGVVALVAGLVFSQGALADQRAAAGNVETVTRAIDITGLDLSSRSGAQRLYREIASTAWSICSGTSNGLKGLARVKQQHEQARRCFDEAVNGALAQVTERTGIDLERVAGSDRFDAARLVAWR